MDLYSYIATTNPILVKNLAHKYGFGLNQNPNLPLVLEQLVASQGEPALMDILDNHPDRDIMEEYFDKKNKGKDSLRMASGNGSGCGCSAGCNGNNTCGGCNKKQLAPALAFDGVAALSESKKVTDTTSVIILASAMLITIALISTK